MPTLDSLDQDSTKEQAKTDDRQEEAKQQSDDNSDQDQGALKVSEDKLDALLKKVEHQEQFIEQLKTENKEFRESVATKDSVEDLLEKVTNGSLAKDEATDVEANKGNAPASSDSQVSPEDIESLVDEKLSQREQAKAAQKNEETCFNELKSAYGDTAGDQLKKSMQDLGMGMDEAQEIARKNPAAFKRLFISDQQQTNKQEQQPTRTSYAAKHAPKGNANESVNTNHMSNSERGEIIMKRIEARKKELLR